MHLLPKKLRSTARVKHVSTTRRAKQNTFGKYGSLLLTYSIYHCQLYHSNRTTTTMVLLLILTTKENDEKIEDKDDNNDDEEGRIINMLSPICIYRNGKNMCAYGQ